MRNKIKFISATSALLALALIFTPVFAKDTVNTSEIKAVSVDQKKLELEKRAKEFEIKKLEFEKQHQKEEEKRKVREAKAKEISKLAENQIDRAQKAIDKLQNLVDRIKAQRVKMNAPEVVASLTPADFAKLDAQLALAETQKKDLQTALNDVKAKAAALKAAITSAVNNTVVTDPPVETDPASTPSTPTGSNSGPGKVVRKMAPAPTKEVQEFMASMNLLKRKTQVLHTTLQQIVKTMKDVLKKAEVKREADEDDGKNEDEHGHTVPEPIADPVPTPASTN